VNVRPAARLIDGARTAKGGDKTDNNFRLCDEMKRQRQSDNQSKGGNRMHNKDPCEEAAPPERRGRGQNGAPAQIGKPKTRKIKRHEKNHEKKHLQF
jgi:hypothetical protein